MSVYRRAYSPYVGQLTPAQWRFWVLTRYALKDVFDSRPLLAYLFLTGVPVFAAGIVIYLMHNSAARTLIGLMKLEQFLKIDAEFFYRFLSTQCFLGLILSAWIGPRLIANDLGNGALPLYLSRPFSRIEYVLGKALVLFTLLSSITWVPGLLLYGVNAAIAENGWGVSHFRIVGALVLGGTSWMTVMTLFVLSLSAWIRWHLAASVSMFGIYFISAGLGEAVNLGLGVTWGNVFNLGHLFEVLWGALFGVPLVKPGVPLLTTGIALSVWSIVSMWGIHQRLRAREVVQ
jgi:ABC-2 type transport system permease protein